MVKKLTQARRKALVKSLSAKRASNVAYRNGYISLKFDGKKLRDRIIIKHDPSIADWSRVRSEVHYDEKLTKKDILPVLVHEVIEKYVTQRYHLNVDKESHKIAQKVENKFIGDACSRRYREFCTHTGRCWRLHETRIRSVWKKENK